MVAPFKPGADHYIKVVQRCLVMFNVRYRTPWRHVTPLTRSYSSLFCVPILMKLSVTFAWNLSQLVTSKHHQISNGATLLSQSCVILMWLTIFLTTSHYIIPKNETSCRTIINCLAGRLARAAWVSPRQSHLSPTRCPSCLSSRSHSPSCSSSVDPTSAWPPHFPPLLPSPPPSSPRSSSPRLSSSEASSEGSG